MNTDNDRNFTNGSRALDYMQLMCDLEVSRRIFR